jgi:hypothetical protein
MKKTRLLEIIREEISSALREGEAEEKAAKMAALKATDLEIKALQKKKADMMKTGVAEATLEEDLLNEVPFPDGPLDIRQPSDLAVSPKERSERPLQDAITNAVNILKNEYPDLNNDDLAKLITKVNSDKNRKPDQDIKQKLSNGETIELKADSSLGKKFKDALNSIADTIDDQGEIYAKNKIDDLIQQKGIDDSTIERLEKLKEKGYTYTLGFPQTLKAIERALGGGSSEEDSEQETTPKTSAKPKSTTSTGTKEPKKATLTKGDDGFDDVTYSKPETTTKPKATETDKADTAASKTPKLDKLANNQDALLKAQKETQSKMKELAGKIRGAEGAERENLMGELKKLNKLNGEIQSKLDKLF